jgi:hypothetical protein
LSIYNIFPSTNLVPIALNVPAVTDVFLRPIRKNAQRFYGRKKMWRSKTTQRGASPDWRFAQPEPPARAAKQLPTRYALVWSLTIIFFHYIKSNTFRQYMLFGMNSENNYRFLLNY